MTNIDHSICSTRVRLHKASGSLGTSTLLLFPMLFVSVATSEGRKCVMGLQFEAGENMLAMSAATILETESA